MEAGDLIYKNHQYEFRGLLFGSNTPLVVESMEGLLSMANVESLDTPNMHGHGTFSRPDRLASKRISCDILFNASSTQIDEVLREAQRSFQNTLEEYPLVFLRPGQSKRRVNVRCRRRDIPTSYELAHGMGEAALEFFATDPRVYSNEQFTETFTIDPGQSQATYPIYMGGDLAYGSPPIIEIDGPALNPVIANSDDSNRQLLISYNLGAGQTMAIDLGKKTATVDGVSVYNPGVVLSGTRWWSLLPDYNNITVTRQGTSGTATIRVKWRDAYS